MEDPPTEKPYDDIIPDLHFKVPELPELPTPCEFNFKSSIFDAIKKDVEISKNRESANDQSMGLDKLFEEKDEDGKDFA